MKFIVEVYPETYEETPQELESLIEEAIRDYGYTALAKLVEEGEQLNVQ